MATSNPPENKDQFKIWLQPFVKEFENKATKKKFQLNWTYILRVMAIQSGVKILYLINFY